MTATSTILAGGIAVLGVLCAVVGGVAVLASPFNRRRDNQAVTARSAAADRIASAIMLGEQQALDAEDKLALAAGCARTLQVLLPAEPPAIDWWSRGIEAIGASPCDPGTTDRLRLVACLLYCLDLAGDQLYDAGRYRDADRRTIRPMGQFQDSRILDGIDGWAHLEAHRIAGIYDLAGPSQDPAPRCPFCSFGIYDQRWMRCDRCVIEGEFVRTVPTVALPRRIAPDLRLADRRAREIEARMLAGLRVDSRSN